MQVVTVIGNVGQDPEVKVFGENSKVAKFSVASSEKYKKRDGEMVTDTTWFRCEAWNGLAGVIEKYVRKGTQVSVRGKIKEESWEKDGETRKGWKLVVDELKLLGSGGAGSGSGNNGGAEASDEPPF